MSETEPLIECIAKECYDNFCKVVKKTKQLRKDKQIVIFGAGIMGMQFAYTLLQLGINDFIFCDNNSEKWDTMLIGKPIKNPLFIQDIGRYFVFLAMENYEQCANQLEMMEYRKGKNWLLLTNSSGNKMLESFEEKNDATRLVLGDCIVSNVSIREDDKTSIGELLNRKNTVKVLALNGLYMRGYYNILRLCKRKIKYLKEVYILLNVDIMSGRYFLLPKNQHSDIMRELYKKSEFSDEEMTEFLDIIAEREKNTNILDMSTPNRNGSLSTEEIEKQRRIHMKINFLYRISENTESIEYLERILDFCRNDNVKIIFVIMPINYEAGYKYFGDTFKVRYEKIISVLQKYIIKGKGEVLDLSYLLQEKDFICLRSVNEGIREHGRKKVAAKIEERMRGII